MLERRTASSIAVEQRADADAPGRLVGYASVFNSPTWIGSEFMEQVAPGAFTTAVTTDVGGLHNHDTASVLGRTPDTLRLKEDHRGLKFELDLPNSSKGREIAEAVRRRDIRGMSIGFIARRETWEEMANGDIVRTLLDVDLIEISTTAFPAFPVTSVEIAPAARRNDPTLAQQTRQRLARDWMARRLTSAAKVSA